MKYPEDTIVKIEWNDPYDNMQYLAITWDGEVFTFYVYENYKWVVKNLFDGNHTWVDIMSVVGLNMERMAL